ncbi:5-formyltetrahydrofolate cyclo-ligase [Gorillibacterium timonense]|uniref:5-formyltetrahydrofolate cyclo-ligase n=1 Tax=Gorillibacterium timonense TaxID=1689269 RepID=UPI00071D9FAF|nr:5-formyltetrahydrofolate cyclo-ligase [Gorillibacterium timonense]
MDAAAPKNRMREDMLRLRAALSPEERAERTKALCQRLCAEFSIQLLANGDKPLAYPVLVYLPFGSEPDLMPAIEWLWQRDIPVAAPRALRNPRRLEWRRVQSARDLEPGVWGIREPKRECPLVSEEDAGKAALILVPGVAFDLTGGRLGYGGGYYDRFLGGTVLTEQAQMEASTGRKETPTRTIAAAFDLQLVSHVPTEEHDIRIGCLVTESRTVLCR